MKVVVTGASGFLGSRLADALLDDKCPLSVSQLVLTDCTAPAARSDSRVSCLQLDLTKPESARELVKPDTDVLFHLAAVVSGAAERDFDLGMRVNFDATRNLLEAARHNAPRIRFVFASTVGVLGGRLPPRVDETVATMPETSYGTAKAMVELLVNDYTRRGFVEGVAVRLPTVTVRAGTANAAVTSFASGVVREPLKGERAVIPVPPEQELWVCSPRTAVSGLVQAARVSLRALGPWRVLQLPGLRVAVRDMVAALRHVAGDAVADLVHYEVDETIARMVATFPIDFDTTKALNFGFEGDASFEDIVREYVRETSLQKQ